MITQSIENEYVVQDGVLYGVSNIIFVKYPMLDNSQAVGVSAT